MEEGRKKGEEGRKKKKGEEGKMKKDERRGEGRDESSSPLRLFSLVDPKNG